MSQPRPWLDEIIDALTELGGHGTLADISASNHIDSSFSKIKFISSILQHPF